MMVDMSFFLPYPYAKCTKEWSTRHFRQKTGIFPEFPRLGFALCLPSRIGYVVDSRLVRGFDFHSSRLFLVKQ
jgi:hypothetical protein